MRKPTICTALALMLVLLVGGTALAQRKLSGMVDKLPQGGASGEWVVSGQPMQVTSDTKLDLKHGPAAVGAYVEMKGVHYQGKYVAYEVEVKKFYGKVEKLPAEGFVGEWMIVGQKFQVTSDTKLDFKHGPPKTGSQVKVESDLIQGNYVAREIETKMEK